MSTPEEKPYPTIGPDNAPFWDAIASHQLKLPFCGECGRAHLPPGPVCPFCFSGELEWREASGRGRIASWTVVRKPLVTAFQGDLPYALAMVELVEGPRLISGLADAAVDRLQIGQEVEITFDDVDQDLTLHRFRILYPAGPGR